MSHEYSSTQKLNESDPDGEVGPLQNYGLQPTLITLNKPGTAVSKYCSAILVVATTTTKRERGCSTGIAYLDTKSI